jgi:hypothetical protein
MTKAQELGITEFPFIIRNEQGKEIYKEDSSGNWYKREYDENGKEIYREYSRGFWEKYRYDENGNLIYWENSDGYWEKSEYDQNNNKIYCETPYGVIFDNRPKLELTLDQIAEKFNISVSQLKINHGKEKNNCAATWCNQVSFYYQK